MAATTKVEDLVNDMVSSIPAVYFQLKEAIDNPMSSFMDFENIINKDPRLVARLLRIVNSAYYSLPEKVGNVSRALMIIGVSQLNELILSTSICDQFEGIPKELIDMKTFLRHSICCGMAAKKLADHINEPNSDGFYVAGMLHDIGSLVIFKKKSQQARKILMACKFQHASLCEVEKKILGFDHTQAGAALIMAWRLPKWLHEVTLWHHEPFKSETHRGAAGIVHIADFVSYRINESDGGGMPAVVLNDKVVTDLGFSKPYLDALEEDLKEPFEEAVEAFA